MSPTAARSGAKPPDAPPPRAPRAPRPRRHWLRRLAILTVVLAALLLAAAIAIPIIMQSGLPRRLVLEGVARETGLWIEAGDVDVTLAGVTTIRGVRLGVPLDDQPLLTADVLTVRHTPIAALALRRRLVIDSLQFDRALIDLRERASGGWNAQRAAKVIAITRAGGGTPGGPISIPRLLILDSTVRVARATGEQIELPVALDGAPGPAADWGFEGTLGPSVIRGHIAPTGWMHAIEFEASDLAPLARLWLPDPPTPLIAQGRWEGDVLGGALSASLTIERLAAGPTEARGDLAIATDPETFLITATPGEFEVAGLIENQPLHLRGGRLAWDGVHLNFDDLLLEGLGASAQLDGAWNLDSQLGSIDADFSGSDDLLGLRHRGHLHVAVGRVYGGLNAVNLVLESEGQVGPRRWDGEARLVAQGPQWTRLDGRLETPRLTLTGLGPDRDLSGLSISWNATRDLVALTGLSLPGSPATIAAGEYSLADGRWLLSVEAQEWTIPGEDVAPLAFSIDAGGWGASIDLSHLWVDNEIVRILASGSYRNDRPEPIMGSADLRWAFRGWPASPGHTEHEGDELDDGRGERGPPPGLVMAYVDLAGTLAPRDLTGRGRLRVADVPLGHGVLNPIDVDIQAAATEQAMELAVEPFQLFDGTWTLAAAQPWGTPDGVVQLGLEGGSLARLAELLAPAILIEGRVDAQLAALLPNMETDLATLDGRWSVRDAASGDWSVPEGTGSITLREGRVRLGNMDLRHGNAQASGEIGFDALDPTSLDVALRTQGWPVGVRGTALGFLVDSDLDATIDLTGQGAQGRLDVDADMTVGGSVEGSISARTQLAGLSVAVQRVDADVLAGSVTGSGTLALDEWTRSHVDLRVSGLDLSALSEHASWLGDIGGLVNGRIVAGPSQGERALEPMTYSIDLDAPGASYRSFSFDALHLSGYAGPRRIVLDQGRLAAAGGELASWARLSWHGDEPFLHVNAAARDIDLEQVVHAFAPEYERAAGIVGFDLTFGGYAYHPHRAFGELRADVRQSDLAALPVASQLYALLSLSSGDRSGEGVALARLEEDTLIIEGLRYANRGSELIGAGRVENVWLGLDSPVSGSVAGAVNPLEEGILPLSRELGRAFLAATEKTASVQLSGTLRQMETDVVALERVSETLGRLLGTR